jgi:uncharacterized protein YjbI with pentapeptide repeats
MLARLKSFFRPWPAALGRGVVRFFSMSWKWLTDPDPVRGAISPRFTWLVVPAVVAAVALWQVPRWQVSLARGLSPEHAFELENEARKTLAQIVLGLFGLIALFLTWRRTWTTEQGHFTDRYSKAIEQLGVTFEDGRPNMEARLGGIYALERLARDSPRDQGTILEVFTAYVRRNAAWPPAIEYRPPPMEGRDEDPEPRTDIQAILTVIGRRLRSAHRTEERIDLNRTDLRGANLSRVHLQGASLVGAHLEGASLVEACLQGADFWEAHLEKANLKKANLEGAALGGAHLEEAVLPMAHLEGADLRFAHLEDACLPGVRLDGANLDGARLERTSLSQACLQAANLHLAHLKEADLGLAHLEYAILLEAEIEGANLEMAHLEGVKFITVEQVRSAENWETAHYDAELARKLGLTVPEESSPQPPNK